MRNRKERKWKEERKRERERESKAWGYTVVISGQILQHITICVWTIVTGWNGIRFKGYRTRFGQDEEGKKDREEKRRMERTKNGESEWFGTKSAIPRRYRENFHSQTESIFKRLEKSGIFRWKVQDLKLKRRILGKKVISFREKIPHYVHEWIFFVSQVSGFKNVCFSNPEG